MPTVVHSRHLFPIHVGAKYRDNLITALGTLNIGVTVNYRSVPLLNYYSRKYGINENQYPVSNEWGNGTLSLPLFLGLTNDEQSFVVDSVNSMISKMIGENY